MSKVWGASILVLLLVSVASAQVLEVAEPFPAWCPQGLSAPVVTSFPAFPAPTYLKATPSQNMLADVTLVVSIPPASNVTNIIVQLSAFSALPTARSHYVLFSATPGSTRNVTVLGVDLQSWIVASVEPAWCVPGGPNATRSPALTFPMPQLPPLQNPITPTVLGIQDNCPLLQNNTEAKVLVVDPQTVPTQPIVRLGQKVVKANGIKKLGTSPFYIVTFRILTNVLGYFPVQVSLDGATWIPIGPVSVNVTSQNVTAPVTQNMYGQGQPAINGDQQPMNHTMLQFSIAPISPNVFKLSFDWTNKTGIVSFNILQINGTLNWNGSAPTAGSANITLPPLPSNYLYIISVAACTGPNACDEASTIFVNPGPTIPGLPVVNSATVIGLSPVSGPPTSRLGVLVALPPTVNAQFFIQNNLTTPAIKIGSNFVAPTTISPVNNSFVVLLAAVPPMSPGLYQVSIYPKGNSAPPLLGQPPMFNVLPVQAGPSPVPTASAPPPPPPLGPTPTPPPPNVLGGGPTPTPVPNVLGGGPTPVPIVPLGPTPTLPPGGFVLPTLPPGFVGPTPTLPPGFVMGPSPTPIPGGNIFMGPSPTPMPGGDGGGGGGNNNNIVPSFPVPIFFSFPNATTVQVRVSTTQAQPSSVLELNFVAFNSEIMSTQRRDVLTPGQEIFVFPNVLSRIIGVYAVVCAENDGPCGMNATIFFQSPGFKPQVQAPTIVASFPRFAAPSSPIMILMALPVNFNQALFSPDTQTAVIRFSNAQQTLVPVRDVTLTTNGFFLAMGNAPSAVGPVSAMFSPNSGTSWALNQANFTVISGPAATPPPTPTPVPLPPNPPPNVRLSNLTATFVDVEWLPSNGIVSGYQIVFAVYVNGSFSTAKIDVGNVLAYRLTAAQGIRPNTRCMVAVLASNAIAGDGAPSSFINFLTPSVFIPVSPTPVPTPIPIPPPVQNVRAVNVSYYSALVQWQPVQEGFNITNYFVYVGLNGNFFSSAPMPVPNNVTQIRVTLAPGSSYAIRVEAVNRFGRGQYGTFSFSAPPLPIMATPPPNQIAGGPTPTPLVIAGPPAQPNTPTPVNRTIDSVAIAWGPARDNGSPLIGWKLLVGQIDDSTGGLIPPMISFNIPPNANTWTVRGLLPSSFYGFVLTASNSIGDSIPSNMLQVATAKPVVSVCSSALALIGANFTSGSSAALQFNIPAVSSPGPVSCSSLFESSNITAFGSSPICTWVAPHLLSISFSSGTSVTPVTNLAIKRISPPCGTALSAELTSFRLALPSFARAPEAKIKGPEKIAQCSGLTLDGSYSVPGFGRIVSFIWTASNPDLNLLVSNVNRPVLNINSSVMANVASGEQVFFTLTVVDSFGKSSAEVDGPVFFTVTRDAGAPPVVSISSPQIVKMNVSDSLRLLGGIQLPSCGAVSQPPLLNWTINPAPAVPIPQSALNGIMLVLPKRALAPTGTNQDNFYTVTLTVTLRDGATGSAQVKVQVDSSPLVPIIRGGNRVMPLAGAPLVLDASPSVDPDDSNSNVTYAWTCCRVDMTSGDCFSTCPPPQSLILPTTETVTTPVLRLDASDDQPFEEGNFRYTVDIQKGNRDATASVTIKFVSGSVPSVSILPLLKPKHNPSDRLILKASLPSDAPGPFRFSWGVSGASLALSNTSVAPIGTTSSYLVVEKNTMAGGMTYLFRVNVTSPQTTVPGMADIEVTTSSAPFGGTILSNVTTAISGQDYIQLTADSWLSDDSTEVLQYRFSVFFGQTRIPLGDFLPSTTTSFRAPFVSQPTDATIQVNVQNSYGAVSTAAKQVTLLPIPATESKNLMASLLNSTTSLVSSGVADPAQAMRNMVFVTSVLNSNSNASVVPGPQGGNDGGAPAPPPSREFMELRKQALDVLAAVIPSSGSSTASDISALSTTMNSVLAVPSEISVDSAATAVNIMQSVLSSASSSSSDSVQIDSATAENMLSSLGNVLASVAINVATTPTASNDTTADAQQANAAVEIARQVTNLVATVTDNLISQAAPGESVAINTPQVAVQVSRSLPTNVLGSSFSAPSANPPSIAFPPIVGMLSQMTDPVDIHATVWTSNPWSGSSSSANLTSSVSTFKVKQSGSEVPVNNLTVPLQIRIYAPNVTRETASCRFYNTTSNQWSTFGGILHLVEPNYITCNWTHLTDFGVFTQTLAVPPTPGGGGNNNNNPPPSNGGTQTSGDKDQGNGTIVGAIVGAVVAVFLVIAIWLYCRKKQNNKTNPYSPTTVQSAPQYPTQPTVVVIQAGAPQAYPVSQPGQPLVYQPQPTFYVQPTQV